MDKYIKLEDALKAVRDNTMPLDCWHIDRMRAIAELPTIEVSEDCISREYILSFLDGEIWGDDDYIAGMNDEQREIREVVRNAPSVVPSRAEGEWITEKDSYEIICNKCGCEAFSKYGDWFESDYCPNCGAKMKG